MSEIAFINNYKSEKAEHVIIPLISFKSVEEYQKLKDWDKQDLIALMRKRNAEKTAERVINSSQFDKAIEEAIGEIIQRHWDKR